MKRLEVTVEVTGTLDILMPESEGADCSDALMDAKEAMNEEMPELEITGLIIKRCEEVKQE